MFCYQCQETAKGTGCNVRGVCGKTEKTANLQDLLIYTLKGLSLVSLKAGENNIDPSETDKFIVDSLFATITNANFSNTSFIERIKEALIKREKINLIKNNIDLPDAATWTAKTEDQFAKKAQEVGILKTENEDIRSLKELLIYGIKGIAAYTHHAFILNHEKKEIYDFIKKALASTLDDNLSSDELFNLVVECGRFGVEALSLIDTANTSNYGHPTITEVNIGVRNNPGILISGHDLKDMEELLKQTENTGIDIYTHSEMLSANYYPAFKKYKHFVGNYGNAWWEQGKDFEKFNGPILMTTNCLIPPKDFYKDRIYTTGVVEFEGIQHIDDRKNGKPKDFSGIVEHAKRCSSPIELEKGSIVGGFAHDAVAKIANTVADTIKSGDIKKIIVMAGCDGRMKSREYYSEFAKALPKDTLILTAGCAKYRYNKLNLKSINGIPRVLDAGQCNDSYSLVVTALKLKEIFGLNDINDLPIEYNIAWYEQKAVIVLLALLYLGVKNIHLGPTLPAFLSPNVAKVLINKFGISPISIVGKDIQKMSS